MRHPLFFINGEIMNVSPENPLGYCIWKPGIMHTAQKDAQVKREKQK